MTTKPKTVSLNKKRLSPGDLCQYDNHPQGFYLILGYHKDAPAPLRYNTPDNTPCYEVLYLNLKWFQEFVLEDLSEKPRAFMMIPCHILKHSKLVSTP